MLTVRWVFHRTMCVVCIQLLGTNIFGMLIYDIIIIYDILEKIKM